MLAFVALFILPVVAVWGGFEQHMDRATTTQFCLSCHVMLEYGQSLHYDDKELHSRRALSEQLRAA